MNAAAIVSVLALLAPFVVGLVTKATWPTWVRQWLLYVVCAAIGFFWLVASGQLEADWASSVLRTAEHWAAYFLLVFGVAMLVFENVIRRFPALQSWLDRRLIA